MKFHLRSVLGALALMAAGAVHAGTIGTPFYTIDHQVWDENFNSLGDYRWLSSRDAVNGQMIGYSYLGPSALPPVVGSLYGIVRNDGVPFWAEATTPLYKTLPHAPGSPIGGRSEINIWQTYQKSAPDAKLNFTYSGAKLELYRDVEVGSNCDGCTEAGVRWTAEVFQQSDPRNAQWSESQSAALFIDNAVLRLDVVPDNHTASPVNPLWQWDCVTCGNAPNGRNPATLDAPYRGQIDLSGVPYDFNLPASQQPEILVHYKLEAYAWDLNAWGGAFAHARDPLDGDDGGISFDMSGLVPTNHAIPAVPEPGTWATMLVGLIGLGIGLRRRRHCAHRAHRTARVAGTGLLLLALAPSANAQALLTERYATAWGYFVMGYATLSDSGNEEITRTDPVAHDAFEVFDSGVIDASYGTRPVYAVANFRSKLTADFDPYSIAASGSTEFYAAGAQDYVGAGGRSGSNARFGFHLDQATPYRFIVDLTGTSSDSSDLLLRASLGQDSGRTLHFFEGIGHFEAAGVLQQGDYGVSARATAYDNHSGQYSYSLILGAVPEPGALAMTLAGLAVIGGVMWRRGRPI